MLSNFCFLQFSRTFISTKMFVVLFFCFQNTSYAGTDSAQLHFPKTSFLNIDEKLIVADDLFVAGLYDRAIESYQTILNKPSKTHNSSGLNSVDPQTIFSSRFHLAHLYYITKKYSEAIPLLLANTNATESPSKELEVLRQNSRYLLGLVYKQNNKLDDALKMMEDYLNNSHHQSNDLSYETKFEIALIYFLKGDLSKAAHLFESLQLEPTSRLSLFRQLYLARILIAEKNNSKAISLLKTLSSQIDQDNELNYELSFLLGEANFRLHAFSVAAKHFEQAIPKHFPETYSWYGEVLYFLGWSFLNLAETPGLDSETKILSLKKSEDTFLNLLAHKPQERAYLALGQTYLAKAKLLQDPSAYNNAEEVLSQKDHFTSLEGQTQALLLRAEAAPAYSMRNHLYLQIINLNNVNSPFYNKGWFLHGQNDFEEGKRLIHSTEVAKGKSLLANAALSFHQAFNLLKEQDKALAIEALKYQALALGESGEKERALQALSVIDDLIKDQPEFLNAFEHQDEIFYLKGFFALQLTESNQEEYLLLAEESFNKAAALPNNTFGDAALNQLAAWHYRNNNIAEAEKIYLRLIELFPNSSYIPEAWLRAAYCADKKGDPLTARQRRSHVVEHYPNSSLADEAFFGMYTYRDYLQGEREPLKHLQSFPKHYPESPYLMQSYYLIGMNAKKNRKTVDGKWIKKRSLTDAIEAFHKGEILFDPLISKGIIPEDKLNFYTNIYYRLILERAMANLAIAEESQGAKRQIYLEYAEEVFKHLLAEFDLQNSPHTKRLINNDSFPSLYEECVFCLAQTYIRRQNDTEANALLSKMENRYKEANITKGYYLSRVKYEQGKIAFRQNNPLKALHYFKESEDSARGNLLATNEKLDLWIQQSHCCRDLRQFDEATLILSKVANDDAVSSLRLKAMYLRSEIYELQGRPELARKQLESLAKKGGEWAKKAQEQLEKHYGY